MAEDKIGLRGVLDFVKIPHGHDARSVRIPGFGRIIFTRDPGVATRFAREQFQTHLSAVHRDGDGKLKKVYDLGSGTVTNVGVLSMANDWNWASPSGAAINTLKLQNYHAVGTGTNAAAITDIQLQTLAAPTTTTAVTGAQSLVAGSAAGNNDAASIQTYQTVATTNFSGPAAITEWGLFNAATLSATTGSPFSGNTATSTTASVTGTPFTASSTTVQGQQQFIFQDTTAGPKFWGLVLSNSTSVITVPAWYTTTAGSVSSVNPVNADNFTIQPVLFDHQVFSAINVINGDSVQWQFKLQIVSGG